MLTITSQTPIPLVEVASASRFSNLGNLSMTWDQPSSYCMIFKFVTVLTTCKPWFRHSKRWEAVGMSIGNLSG